MKANEEIEIRFDLKNNIEVFEKLPNVKINQIVSILNTKSKTVSEIKELIYTNGIKAETKYLRKTNKEKVKSDLKLENNFASIKSINKSEELPITEFKIQNDPVIRCKLRKYIEFKTYRIDYTLVVNDKKLKPLELINTVVREIFTNNKSIKDSIRYLTKNNISHILELEVELLDNSANVENIIKEVDMFLYNLDRPTINYEKHSNDIYNVNFYNNKQEKGLKSALPQAITLTRNIYTELYGSNDLYMTIKIDGERCICVINNGFKIIDMKYEVLLESKLETSDQVILDGEFCNGKFYIFDVLYYSKIPNIYESILSKRLNAISDIVILCNSLDMPIYPKNFTKLDGNIKDKVSYIYNNKYDFPIDGLIIVKDGENYKNTITYKYKELKDTTIDFYIYKDNDRYVLLNGINPTIYNGFGLTNKINSIESNEKYFPTLFTPSDDPNNYKKINIKSFNKSTLNINNKININDLISEENYSGLIGEFVFIDNLWELVRIRKDKCGVPNYYGNDFRIAETNWLNYLDPFPINQLWEGTGKRYFTENFTYNRPKHMIYLSIVKQYRISLLESDSTVIDIGSGKGQDLYRYLDINLKRLICIDNDTSALAILVERHYNEVMKKPNKYNTLVNIANLDLTKDNTKYIKKTFGIDKVNYVVCNLAIHYFIGESEDTLVNFIDSILDGKLQFTCFMGDRIDELFTKHKTKENETVNWTTLDLSLKKLYNKDTPINMRKIGVKLPFNKDEYTEEYIMNNVFIEKLKSKGFGIISEKSIIEYLPYINEIKLTNEEIDYVSLYGDYVFIRE